MDQDSILQMLRWVWGVCILWNREAKQFNDVSSEAFQDFVHRTHEAVCKYVTTWPPTTTGYSDFECSTALEAEEFFGELFLPRRS